MSDVKELLGRCVLSRVAALPLEDQGAMAHLTHVPQRQRWHVRKDADNLEREDVALHLFLGVVIFKTKMGA